MKRKNLLILGLTSLFMLTSCGGVEKPIDDTSKKLELTDEMFVELGKQYHLENVVHEKINNSSKYYINESLHNGSEFTYEQYKSFDTEAEINKETRLLFETYSREKESGKLLASRLDVGNKIAYYDVMMPDGSGYMNWDLLGYDNMFKDLKSTHFSKFSEDTYTLDLDNPVVKPLAKRIGTQLYGNGGFDIQGLSLYIDKTGITSFNTVFKDYISSTGNTTYSYTIDSKVVAKGESVKFTRRAQPKEAIEDAAFTTAINSLKEHNFTMTHTNYVKDVVTHVNTIKTNKDKLYSIRENKEEKTTLHEAIYKKGDSFYNATLIGANLYQAGVVDEKIFTAHFPTFDIARSSFKKDETGTYVFLKNEIEGDFDVATQFENEVTILKDFTIKLEEGKITFTNSSKDFKTVVEFTNINSTDTGFTSETVKIYDSTKATWDDLVRPNDLAIIQAIFGDDYNVNLPIPANMRKLDSWSIMDLSEDPNAHIYLLAYQPTGTSDFVPVQKDVDDYATSLTALGYTKLPKPTLGEVAFTKYVSFGGVVYNSHVEPILDTGTFMLYINIQKLL